ncbi:MAG: S-methyl-5-thioribose-1-phosphate isomerase [Candidatus Zixiibacteriota bacterium]
MTFETLHWDDGTLVLLDQRLLPTRVENVRCTSVDQVTEAIRNLTVRGAPAIGVSAAYGMVLAATGTATVESIRADATKLKAARPTAVNLAWAVNRMLRVVDAHAQDPVAVIRRSLEQEAIRIHDEDAAMCRRIGEHGAVLLRDGMTILTHCNAGALATAGMGTALSVIYVAAQQGKNVRVYADETRPVLQGARLTMWELMQENIDATLITDNTAASLFAAGKIDAVIVGADRIAANGDVANKIGTYNVAILAAHHNVPFYVAAPRSTFDPNIATGADIPIEERSSMEVTHVGNAQLAPDNARVYSPAFDVTPKSLVTAIIWDIGVEPGGRGSQ